MVITHLPSEGNRVVTHGAFPNPSKILKEVKEWGLNKKGVIESWPIQSAPIPKGFNDWLLNAVYDHLGSVEQEPCDLETLRIAGRDDGMVVGCFAAEPHTDTDVSLFAHRWLVVLQVQPGFRMRGFDDNGPFLLDLEPGQVIAFDETQVHSVEAYDPLDVDVTIPNLFYTVPDPIRWAESCELAEEEYADIEVEA